MLSAEELLVVVVLSRKLQATSVCSQSGFQSGLRKGRKEQRYAVTGSESIRLNRKNEDKKSLKRASTAAL
jgi:hypothetical protein